MEKFLLILSLLIVALFGCSNQSVSTDSMTSENNLTASSKKEKETQKTHEISSEDKKIIQSIKNKEYDQVIEETRNLKNEFKKDYYFIASAYKKLEELKDVDVSLDNYDTYTYVDAMLDKVDHKNSHEDLDFLQTQDNNKKNINALQKGKNDQIEENIKESEKVERSTAIEERTNNPQNVSVGMTKEEVLIEGWGKPEKVKTTQTADQTLEQWIYKGNKYLYFENGILSTISY
ncbi:hypothetical protein ABE33_11235 [Bacillus safensis]|uniref:Lipoprotein n=1 Tax=Bacillus safensis TaxID=561879 RepID=A0A5C0WCV1_BACIA|nr:MULTISPECIES: hypothetical protein [Bacillus]MBG9825882.1 hypothetical protein [Bacillus safensis]MBG9835529.1 hypothetical protein [Bacillus safensis]MBG9861590.1 hypothetical protein [Bacillus safensis]MBG9900469.1 hypothetical protein [Bacillus safensis]QEK62005.1 hypothetical protein FX981_00169 [Bacillus safensis]